MKNYVFVLIFILALMSQAKAKPCYEYPDQNSQNQCAYEEYQASQKKLDEMYQKVLAHYFKTESFLQKYYEHWQFFRKTHCDLMTLEWGSGSMAGFIHSGCMNRLTKSQISDFQKILNP